MTVLAAVVVFTEPGVNVKAFRLGAVSSAVAVTLTLPLNPRAASSSVDQKAKLPALSDRLRKLTCQTPPCVQRGMVAVPTHLPAAFLVSDA